MASVNQGWWAAWQSRWLSNGDAARLFGWVWSNDSDIAADKSLAAGVLAQPADVINGTPNDDSLVGTSGDDTLNGRQGADTMTGAGGNDLYLVDNLGDQVIELAGEGTDTVKSRVDHTLAANVENLVMVGGLSLHGTGNEQANRIDGNQGDDTLDGADGDDTLLGHRGNDELLGGAGNDLLQGGVGDDLLDGGSGADTLRGGAGNDSYVVDDLADVTFERADAGVDTVYTSVDWTLAANVENLVMTGWPPAPGLTGIGNALDNAMSGGLGDDFIDGGDGDDTIEGGYSLSPSSADTLMGGDGNDSIHTGGGYHEDQMYGGAGNDTLSGAGGSLHGDDGDDLLIGGTGYGHHAVSNSLSGGAGQDTLQGGGFMDGGDGDDLIDSAYAYGAYGGAGNDTITGSGGGGYTDYDLDAGDGDDQVSVWSVNHLTIAGGTGNDSIVGDSVTRVDIDAGTGNDTVSASSGSGQRFTVSGGGGSDVVTASGYGGEVYGDGGNDRLTVVGRSATDVHADGGAGNDTLTAGGGVATLTGGDGDDTFVLQGRESEWQNMVFVADFLGGDDTLAVSQSHLAVGNGDQQVDGAVTVTGPGGFDAGAELVIVAADIFGDLSLDKAAAAIGSANQSYEAGQTVLFMVDNGTDSWALYFTSSGADASVSAAELSVVGRLSGAATTSAEDIVWSV
ncbi:calcium-binding protein [Ideonella sp.]|uniref:calcium-binding protein n=1 Tax=Ideonella sp. TaxID=1929293 RepID=UPI0035B11AE3